MTEAPSNCSICTLVYPFSDLTLLANRKGIRPIKKSNPQRLFDGYLAKRGVIFETCQKVESST